MKEGIDTPAEFLHSTQECDLVLKGGITSGIVYPPVVLKLPDAIKITVVHDQLNTHVPASLSKAFASTFFNS